MRPDEFAAPVLQHGTPNTMSDEIPNNNVEKLLDTPALADALESDQFKQFLDHIPFAIAVSELGPSECIVYANIEFERLTGQSAVEFQGKSWDVLPVGVATADGRELSQAIVESEEHLGIFAIQRGDTKIVVNAWSNQIHSDDGTPMFRLVALAETIEQNLTERQEFAKKVEEKDTQLKELQHRVTNNLQMITGLIRLEARNISGFSSAEAFDRLAGRIESLSLLYRALSDSDQTTGGSVDLGVYLNQLASAVMVAHAVEGIHFDLQVDTWPVSINVAMPTGLVVNELLTNSLKHAFTGRSGGTISLHSIVDAKGCTVTVADDGIGLAPGTDWPKQGKLGALIVRSLRQNAHAQIDVVSAPDKGVRVTIFFSRANATDRAPAAH
jgi:two-component sensor histidine kinase